MNPRLSASLILCREKLSRFEILMIRRKLGLSFSEALIFPGGSLEPNDSSVVWHDILSCSTDIISSTPFSQSIDLTSLRIAAIRETWEEIGVLLASQKIRESSEDFLGLCQRNGVRPYIEKLHYLTRCIAPASEKKRFDTSFFISIEGGQEVVVDNKESDEFMWGEPEFFLEEFKRNRIKLWPPQVFILTTLRAYQNLNELFSKVAHAHRCPMLFQIAEMKNRDIVGYLPGDYRHEFTTQALIQEKAVHCLISNESNAEIYQSESVTKFLNSIF